MPRKTPIKTQKAFQSWEQGVFVNVLRTADALVRAQEAVLKPTGLTHTQFNVLRILRGVGPRGLSCQQVAARMLTRDPDVTRLLDRLELRGLVRRARETRDRRVVMVRITEEGLRILKELDPTVAEFHRRQLGHLGGRRLRRLIELLELARASPR